MNFLEYDQKLIIEGLKQAIANVLLEDDCDLFINFRLESDDLVLISNKDGKVYELGRLCNRRK